MSAKMTVTGHLGKDPEIRHTPSGAGVLDLEIAATHQRKNQGGQWEPDGDPLWIKAPLWGATAERFKDALAKGDRVSVEGTLRRRTYTRADGSPGEALDLVNTRFLGYIPRQPRADDHAPPPSTPGPDPWATPADAPPF